VKLLPNFGSLNVKFADYIWYPAAEAPVETPVVPAPAPLPTPTLPKFKPSPTLISADELLKNLENHYAQMQKIPNWQALLEAENLAKKQARIAARRERKFNRKGQLAA
jgi:hypothetical protein